MRDVYEFAKYFIKNGYDSKPNTYDGNMKIQKLLVFSQLFSLAEYNEPLFDDDILAFQNGCVIEKVRLRYKNDYIGFKNDSDMFQPNFSEREYNILKTIINIFGDASARELSEINHRFDFWKNAYNKGTNQFGYHDKHDSIVDIISNKNDLQLIKDLISSYKKTFNDVMANECINGITFFYDNMELTDEIIDKLEMFSYSAEDDSYTVYIDEGELVIY